MDNLKKPYQKPVLVEVSLMPEEATLCVCKNPLHAGSWAKNWDYCASWSTGWGSPCKDTVGS